MCLDPLGGILRVHFHVPLHDLFHGSEHAGEGGAVDGEHLQRSLGPHGGLSGLHGQQGDLAEVHALTQRSHQHLAKSFSTSQITYFEMVDSQDSTSLPAASTWKQAAAPCKMM